MYGFLVGNKPVWPGHFMDKQRGGQQIGHAAGAEIPVNESLMNLLRGFPPGQVLDTTTQFEAPGLFPGKMQAFQTATVHDVGIGYGFQ